ncbi:MAG: hypothetical protein GF418_16780 [Chitinivibrionales bacterium]|nr:hypothetical protein [Chitinivibrionales bacterium]MBD3397277.1 hypothetical protein [Chitinivibrionales bacterium]
MEQGAEARIRDQFLTCAGDDFYCSRTDRDPIQKRAMRTLLPGLLLSCVLYASVPIAQTASTAASDSSQELAKEIVESPVPVLVDFWAPWCMPCLVLNPVVKDIEKTYAGRVRVMKINIDLHKTIANYFRIRSIPAIFLVKDATVVKHIPGVQKKAVYVAAVEEVLAMKGDSATGGTTR